MKFSSLLVCTLLCLPLMACAAQAEDKYGILQIEIQGVDWKDDGIDGPVPLTAQIPAKYIGPKELPLAQRILRERKGKIIPLAFTYPDFGPWPKDWRAREATGDDSLMYGTLSAGWSDWLRNSAERRTKDGYPTSKSIVDAVGAEYGMAKFNQRGAGQYVYYYRASVPENDSLVECPYSKVQKCRAYFAFGDVSLEMSLPQDQIGRWQIVKEKLQNIVDLFHVNRKTNNGE